MPLKELLDYVESESLLFDKVLERCNIFTEASISEYEVNLKEAQLKVLKESGTEEDLLYLESAAKEGLIVRANNTLKKMAEELKEFIKKCAEKVSNFFSSEGLKSTLDKAEKTIEKNPKLKSAKVKVPDKEKIKKTNDKYESEVNKKIALFKAGKFSNNDMQELDKIDKNYTKEIAIATASVVTVGVITAIALCKKNKVEYFYDDEIALPDLNKIVDLDEGAYTVNEKISRFMKAESLRSKIKKSNGKFACEYGPKVLDGIKKIFTSSKPIDNPTFESGEVNTDIKFREILDYSKLDSMLESVMKEVEENKLNNSDNEEEVKESTSESEQVTLEEYLESMEKELFSEEEEVVEESTEVEESSESEKSMEEFLEDMEKALFKESADETINELETKLTASNYLESMEKELFGDDDENNEVVEEKSLDEKLEEIMKELQI